VTVVEDSDDLIALYLAPGTMCKGMNPPGEGIDYNELLLAKSWPLLDVRWKWTRVLMLAKPDEWCSVWGLWPENGGDLLAWYVNLEEPMRRSHAGFDSRDLQLDLVLPPDRSHTWKDVEEYEEMRRLGLVSAEEDRTIRAEGERVIELVERGETWWEKWRDWAPDPSWPIPVFPEGWDRV
jgi:uncharacterized protein DUF402